MILTCPSCATQYSVDAARMDRPRRVRCASCKTAWTASPGDDAEELPAGAQLLGDDTPAFRAEPPAPVAAQAEPEAPAAEKAGHPVAKLFRQKTKAKQQTRKAVAAGVVWGGLAACMALVVGAAALFRVEVVRLIPATAGAYAHLGLPVNPVGLAPEGVEAGPGLHNGHAAVIVTGKLRNVQTRVHAPAPLRIILMDKSGHRLADQVLPAGEHPIQPGETQPFHLAFLDPPSGVAQVQVEFAFDRMKVDVAGKPAHGEKAGHGKAEAAHGEEHAEEHGGGHAPAAAHGEPEHGAPAHGEAHGEAAHPAPAAHEPAHAPAHSAVAEEHHDGHASLPLGLRGSAAPSHVEQKPAKVAQPLPKDSPYALPAPARKHADHG